jgi:hypothetical protein
MDSPEKPMTQHPAVMTDIMANDHPLLVMILRGGVYP